VGQGLGILERFAIECNCHDGASPKLAATPYVGLAGTLEHSKHGDLYGARLD
jgi:hypothetical protein